MKPTNYLSCISSPVSTQEGFTWQEFVYSDTALKYGLSNEPPLQARKAIHQLVNNLLNPLRRLYGKTIRITSGYRSPEVNFLVRGIPNSQHTKGEAVDLWIPEGPEFLFRIVQSSGLIFDQAIIYRKRFFLHISYTDGCNRREVFYQ